MSLGIVDDWACEVYELSADVCAASRNTAELLKCLQQLVNVIYPSLCGAAQHQQQRAGAAGAAATAPTSGGPGRRVSPPRPTPAAAGHAHNARDAHAAAAHGGGGEADTAPEGACGAGRGSTGGRLVVPTSRGGGPNVERRGEVHAALYLYFSCVPSQPKAAEKVKLLRALPADLLRDEVVALALAAAAAATQRRCVAFMGCYWAAPQLLRRIMECGAHRVRLASVKTTAVAYHTLPAALLARRLGLAAVGQQPGCTGGRSSSCGSAPDGSGGSHPDGGCPPWVADVGSSPGQARRAEAHLLALLQEAARGGCRGAANALGHVPGSPAVLTEGAPAASASLPEVLRFRA